MPSPPDAPAYPLSLAIRLRRRLRRARGRFERDFLLGCFHVLHGRSMARLLRQAAQMSSDPGALAAATDELEREIVAFAQSLADAGEIALFDLDPPP